MSDFKGTMQRAASYVGGEIKSAALSKAAGFYVGAAAWLLTLVHTITYSTIPGDISNPAVIAVGVVGIILFPLLSLFKKTSVLAPIALMICDFMALMCTAGADGIIDYLSTQFFNGVTLEAIFSLPFGLWFSAISFIVSFILSSVAIYLPQQKREKVAAAPAENAVATE